MLEFYLSFLLVFFLLLIVVKVFGIFLKKKAIVAIDPNEIAVVIPFRNEENNLQVLLESFLKQSLLPNEIILVNDHSNDESVSIVDSYLGVIPNLKLLHLDQSHKGKKSALKVGFSSVNTRFVLTMDADIEFSPFYFENFEKLTTSGILSFPVVMKSSSLFGKFVNTEHLFFNAFNFLISPIWPISISGANLLIDRTQIDYEKQLEEHSQIASGDDYFLLHHARRKGIPIEINNQHGLLVETHSVETLSDYLSQRIRWLGKGKHNVNGTDAVIGLVILLYFIGGLLTLSFELLNENWIGFLIVFLVRFLMDAFVLINYVQSLKETRTVFLLPFFQLVYPLLFLTVSVASLFYKPTWKNRKIQV